jgi:ribose-phosphate pyrophosphokinase
MKLISGSSNQPLADQIAEELNIEKIPIEISLFGNGEKRVWIKDDIHGENIILLQSFSHPTDEHIIEFLLLTDALERLGARHINLVIPWMGYSFQDKVFRQGEPIAAKVVANLVSNSYVKRAFLLDLHNSSTTGFFSIPTFHISAMKLFSEYAQQNLDIPRTIVASPDFGGLKRARVFANLLGTGLINIDKHRDLHTGKVTAIAASGGEVKDKTVILFDDCIMSGNTVVETTNLLKELGAGDIHFFATHGVFSNDAIQKIEESPVTSVITTNSVHHEQKSNKIKTISCSPVICATLSDWL